VASVYLVAGPARATIARRLAERLAGVHVEAAAGADIDALWRTGASVVVEYEGALALLGEYRTWLRSRPCHVVVVHPPDAPCDDAAPRVGLWLETDAHTAEETVDAILGATLTPRSPTPTSSCGRRRTSRRRSRACARSATSTRATRGSPGARRSSGRRTRRPITSTSSSRAASRTSTISRSATTCARIPRSPQPMRSSSAGLRNGSATTASAT